MTSPISFVLHFSGIALETGLLAAVKPFLDWTVDSKRITKNEYIYIKAEVSVPSFNWLPAHRPPDLYLLTGN